MSVHAPRAPAVLAAAPAAPALLLGALVLILLVLCAASLAVGRAPLDVGQAIAQWVRGESTLATLVLIELRVPRTLLAVLVGGSLGLAGAALQGLLRNPLAEPGIIGVSSCAAFGAVHCVLQRNFVGGAARFAAGRHCRGVGRCGVAVCARRARREYVDIDPGRRRDQRLRRGGHCACAESRRRIRSRRPRSCSG